MNEEQTIWKPILGYEEHYMISNNGEVKSIKREVEFINRWGQKCIRIVPEKKLIQKISYNGYCRVFLSKNSITKPFSIHRLVAINFIKNPNNKLEVNHIDGNKLNNSVDNLEWNTRVENQSHAIKNKLVNYLTAITSRESYRIFMVNKHGEIEKIFNSLCEANRNGYSRTCLSRAIKNNKLFKGYKIYKYANTL